jgi:DNA-binding MarR family transcriptional regulator
LFPDFHLIHRAAQRADQVFSTRHSEVTPRQFLILVALAKKQGMRQTELTHLTSIDRSTMTGLIQRLVKRKFIIRRRAQDDARAYAVRLTSAGRHALEDASKAAAATDTALFSGLTASQRSQLLATLDTIVTAGEGSSDK